MEFLRKFSVQTQSYLKGLTVSQRMAIGSCVALIVVSLMWLVDWAAKPALIPLLDQPMSVQELTAIQQKLDTQRVDYKVSGTVVMVPADNRTRLLAQLGEQKVLPNDISIGFSKLMEESSPWLSMEEQGRRWSIARSYELSRILREFDGVRDARVLIDEKTRRTIGQAPVTPTASVFVKMAPGVPLDRDRVFAMASFVSRAVAGLDLSSVAVTDATTGRSHAIPTAAEGMAFDDLEDRQKKEEYFANKIKSLLANIPGLLVAVHAELDTEARTQTKQTYGRPVQLTDKTETMIQERGGTGSGAGVVPNTSRSVANGAPTDKTEKTINESTFEGKVDVTQVTTEAPRHGLKSLSASVNVPRSYLAAIYKQANNAKEPTDVEIEEASKAERDKILRQVERALAIPKGSDGVVVDWFHDDTAVKLNEVMEAGPSDGVMTFAKAHMDKIGVGALGVVSLFMMLMMIRRTGDSGPVLPSEDFATPARGRKRRVDLDPVMIARPPVGEADVTEQLLVAKEVDEHTVHSQQVVEQVVQMIQDDTQATVSILKSWVEGDRQ